MNIDFSQLIGISPKLSMMLYNAVRVFLFIHCEIAIEKGTIACIVGAECVLDLKVIDCKIAN